MNSLVALANSPLWSMAKWMVWDYVINAVDDVINGSPEEIEAKKQWFNYRLERAIFDYNSVAPWFSLSPNPKQLTDVENSFFMWWYQEWFFTKKELQTFNASIEWLWDNMIKRSIKAAELFWWNTKTQDVSSIKRLNTWSVSVWFMTQDEIDSLPASKH